MQETYQVTEVGHRPQPGEFVFLGDDGNLKPFMVVTPYDVWPELGPVNRADGWEPTDDWSQAEQDAGQITTGMTGTLTFDLMDPDGIRLHQDSINGSCYRGAIQALDTWLRSKLDHAGDLPAAATVALESCRRRLILVTEHCGLPVWD